MPIPYYLANPSPFMGLEKDDPDERPTSPFDPVPDAPPSVNESKAAAPPKIDPFADDPNDPRVQRLRDLDQQISGRYGSLGGIIASLSPHGDRQMANLMAQRHLAGQEYHGNQQLRRQLESSRLMNESQMKHWDTLQRNADVAAAQRAASADTRAGAQMGVQGLRNEGNLAVQGLRNQGGVATQGVKNEGALAVQGLRSGGSTAPGRAPVNPQVPVIQAELRQLSKALNDPNLNDDQKLPLMRKYNIRMQQLKQMGGQPAPAPSAAPSTAPSVDDSKTAVRPSATGPNGEKVEWDGTAWVPVS